MIRTLALCSAAALAASALPTLAASPLPSTPPPASDGSSGSFDAQFGAGGYVWFNTDNGEVWSSASGGYVAFTVPYKVETWNGQTFNAYNFTDMNVESTVNLIIYGSEPAMFLASENVEFAGQFTIAAAAGAGGAAPTTNTAYPYDGGTGGSLKGKAGGHGGDGAIGGVQGQCSGEFYTAGGGGGGGNATAGTKGHMGDYPIDGPQPPIHNPGGPPGRLEKATLLVGGGGGGASGGGYANGNFWGVSGANGGGAVVIATSTGSMDIASTGVINANGGAGTAAGLGSGGGGAGGDEWFYSGGAFTNEGSLTATGGLGGTTTYTSGCYKVRTVAGPNGGNGAGGNVAVASQDIANRGVIDVSGGGGEDALNGNVILLGNVAAPGRIAGRLYSPWDVAR